MFNNKLKHFSKLNLKSFIISKLFERILPKNVLYIYRGSL